MIFFKESVLGAIILRNVTRDILESKGGVQY